MWDSSKKYLRFIRNLGWFGYIQITPYFMPLGGQFDVFNKRYKFGDVLERVGSVSNYFDKFRKTSI